MTGKTTYDTFQRNGRYVPILTNPEDDVIKIHTAGEIPGENIEPIIQLSNRNANRTDTVRIYRVPYTGNFWG